MKLGPMIILLIVIQVTIMFFTGVYSSDPIGLDPYNSTTIVNNTSPAVWAFIENPTDWSLADMLTIIGSVIGVAGGIIAGLYALSKSDTVLFMPFAMMFFGFGAIPIIGLYDVIISNSALFGCVEIGCPLATMFFILTGGVIAIMYILGVLSWWTGRSVS